MNKLGQLLVTRGWITVQQLTRGLKNQQVVGGRLGTCLLEMDSLSEDLLLKGLAEQLGVPAAGIDDLRSLPADALATLPPKVARRCRAVPVRLAGGRLDIAMLEPHNLTAQDELAFASGKRVKVHVLHEVRIAEALERYYGEESPDRFTHLLERLNRARYVAGRDGQRTEPPRSFPPPPGGLPRVSDDLAPARSLDAELERALPELLGSAPRPLPQEPVARPQPPAQRVPAPPPPPPPRSVALTAAERAALGPLAGAPPSPPPPALASPAELEEAFAAAADPDEVARHLLAFLARRYARVVLFQVTRDRVAAWMAEGDGIDRECLASFSVGFDQPSVFLNLRHGSGLSLGPLPSMPAHRELAACWGGELPRECLLLPVRLRDRLVAVLYLDAGGGPLGRIDLEGLQRLAAATAKALGRLILRKKKGSASS